MTAIALGLASTLGAFCGLFGWLFFGMAAGTAIAVYVAFSLLPPAILIAAMLLVTPSETTDSQENSAGHDPLTA